MQLSYVWKIDPAMLPWFLAAGAAGGFLHTLLHKGCLTMPRIITLPNGAKALDLGFIMSMLLGAGLAVLVDHSPITAFAISLGGPSMLEGIVKRYSSFMTEKRNGESDGDHDALA